MNPILKNVLAVICGLLLGGIVNMAIILLSGHIIPPPPGTDVTTSEGLQAALPLFEPKHFLMPFLAHALGTLTGAFVTAKIAANNKMRLAIVIGIVNLLGGLTNIFILPSPLWFSILDSVGAYIPMTYLAAKLAIPKEEIEAN